MIFTQKKIPYIILCAGIFISAIIIGSSIFSPSTGETLAAPLVPEQLVPKCSYPGWPAGACSVCDLFALAQNILNYIYYGLAIPITIIMLLYGGFLMIFSGLQMGKSGAYEKGKKILLNTLIGLLIIFLAWLAVDTIIKFLSQQDLTDATPAVIGEFGPWNKVTCAPIISGIPKTHNECQNKACISVDGEGPNSCQTPVDCGGGPTPKHNECNAATKTCVSKPGAGLDQCQNDTQCGGAATLKCSASSVSNETQNMVNCVTQKATEQGLTISSITTNQGSHTCKLTDPKNISCHYGGTLCNGTAHAADFALAPAQRNPANWNKLRSIAETQCGARGAFCESGATRFGNCNDGSINHVHANDSQNCGCN